MIGVVGRYRFEVWERGRMLRAGRGFNGVTNPALNDVLDTYFENGTPAAAWYLGLIRDDNYSAVDADDTMASHAGWEEGTEYTEAARVDWAPDAAANQIKANSEAVEFTINAAQTFNGFFAASDSTKGGTSGTLWATGIFDEPQSMQSGQTLKLFYEIEMIAKDE